MRLILELLIWQDDFMPYVLLFFLEEEKRKNHILTYAYMYVYEIIIIIITKNGCMFSNCK